MRCSLAAFTLLLAAFGPAAIALGPAGTQVGMAADIAPGEIHPLAGYYSVSRSHWMAARQWRNLWLLQQSQAASFEGFDWGDSLDQMSNVDTDGEDNLADIENQPDDAWMSREMSAKEYYYAYIFPEQDMQDAPAENTQDELPSKEYYYTNVFPERFSQDELTLVESQPDEYGIMDSVTDSDTPDNDTSDNYAEYTYNPYAGATYDSSPYASEYREDEIDPDTMGYAVAEDLSDAPSGQAEQVVLDSIVSWMSGSLEGVGDMFHGLSRQVSGLRRETVTVGSRVDRTIN